MGKYYVYGFNIFNQVIYEGSFDSFTNATAAYNTHIVCSALIYNAQEKTYIYSRSGTGGFKAAFSVKVGVAGITLDVECPKNGQELLGFAITQAREDGWPTY